jgi:phosphatidylinositol alpha-1,6-mannosyltransferase
VRSRPEALLLTPAIDGADGISEVSRQTLSALASGLFPPGAVDVWALAGGEPARNTGSRFRSAQGSRARLAGWSLSRARADASGLLIVVLHLHLAPLALPLVVRGARLFVYLQGIESWRRIRARERAALDRATGLIAISRWTAGRFRDANPGACAPVHVCHLGVPPTPADPVPPDRRGYALIVGRLAADERYKGHDALLDCWPEVREQTPAAELLIVGDGDDRGRLESRAAARRLGEAVRFTGRVSDAELAGYYDGAAFFVMPSGGEGFGLAYLEAMRAGKACVAAPGAAEEIVEDGVTGLVVDPSSPGALPAALVTLFRDPETCASMGRQGAVRFRERFEQRHFEERLRAVLAEASVPA